VKIRPISGRPGGPSHPTLTTGASDAADTSAAVAGADRTDVANGHSSVDVTAATPATHRTEAISVTIGWALPVSGRNRDGCQWRSLFGHRQESAPKMTAVRYGHPSRQKTKPSPTLRDHVLRTGDRSPRMCAAGLLDIGWGWHTATPEGHAKVKADHAVPDTRGS